MIKYKGNPKWILCLTKTKQKKNEEKHTKERRRRRCRKNSFHIIFSEHVEHSIEFNYV
jgi:hypothetical protein